MTGLDRDTIDRLTCGGLGTHDVVCPLCSPYRSVQGSGARCCGSGGSSPALRRFVVLDAVRRVTSTIDMHESRIRRSLPGFVPRLPSMTAFIKLSA